MAKHNEILKTFRANIPQFDLTVKDNKDSVSTAQCYIGLQYSVQYSVAQYSSVLYGTVVTVPLPVYCTIYVSKCEV